MARKIGSRYTANQILGRGSAGTVWLGEGPDGPVAIKMLREDLASDQELVGRFVQERTALLGLEHPHIVTVRDLVVDGNDLALVMDIVRGTDLRTRLERERRLAPEAAVAIVADVADGLAAAHAAGVVHRDVKPENILLDMRGPLGPGGAHPALLTDFGVAKLIDSPRRTRATKIIGTPDYLAPEIVEGLPPRAAVDIYALATVLYELLAGFTPSAAATPGRCCAGTSPRPSSRSPASPRSCGSSSSSASPRVPPPGCAPPNSPPACANSSPPSRASPRWRSTSPTPRPPPRNPPPPPRGRTGPPPRRRLPGPRRQTRLQPRHPHLHARPRPRRIGRRRPRHGPRPAHPRSPPPRLGPPQGRRPAPQNHVDRGGGPAGGSGGSGRVGGDEWSGRRSGSGAEHVGTLSAGSHAAQAGHIQPVRRSRTRLRRGRWPGPGGGSPWYARRDTPHPGGTDRRGPTPPGGAVTLGAWQSSMYPKS